ncbi:virulence factor BrkB family protein [uncultured Paraglaciecola sp.]|uniref:virulence factor BrkB family protein n=1 Tax=uncultured Paraglaciecola sp. TaxID=1765024 RepID=UPI0030D8BE36|tara:strand:+ start:52212 stop:53111 length:900 start_codon:yes stop_codon:yes gene_type:complete
MQLKSIRIANIRENMTMAKRFLLLFFGHCKKDKITVSAGHLAYVSLLSLVPFIMVFFTILSAFPAFAEARGDLEELIFSSFVPTAGDQVQTYMSEFVGNASGMGAIGILSLVIVALMLISNIDKTLNSIWQSKSERPLIFTFAIYWMVLTLGPLLMGFSVIMSSYLVGLATYAEEYTAGLTTTLLKTLPFLTSVFAFFIIYMLVPNKKISPKHAACGALVGAVLFEASKKLFAVYVTSFPSYQLIYGALAVIPILFVWVYLSWVVVLVGAEVTHVLEVFLNEESEETFTEDDDEVNSPS